METYAQYNELKDIGKRLLVAIGENPDRPGIKDTPGRFAKYWYEFVNYEPGNLDVTFQAATTDQMVVISGIRIWSLCEHHLLPFWCDIAIGYIAGDKVLGLSKFARIAHKYAHRLQIQERLVDEIAEEVSGLVEGNNVAVLARGKHTCMIMRGIKTDGIMTSSVMRGIFMHGSSARREFLELALDNGMS